jgi:hypothetical protein
MFNLFTTYSSPIGYCASLYKYIPNSSSCDLQEFFRKQFQSELFLQSVTQTGNFQQMSEQLLNNYRSVVIPLPGLDLDLYTKISTLRCIARVPL